MGQDLYSIQLEHWQNSYQRWITQEILTLPWFINIAVIVIFYIVWIKLVDMRRLRELVLFGALIAVVLNFIDIVAVNIGIWEYKVRLFPFTPAPFPFDYTVIPISYMLVMQYTSKWSNYLLGSMLAASIFSFVISPMYVGLGIKVYHQFNYLYMFILVFVVTTMAKVIYNWLASLEVPKILKRI